MAINRDAVFTDSETYELLEALAAMLGNDPDAELGLCYLALSEIQHFIETVH